MEGELVAVTDCDTTASHAYGMKPIHFEIWASKNAQYCFTRSGLAPGVDYYDVLGLAESADEEAVRRAYKQQAMRWHPDKVAAEHKEIATERFKVISSAYAVLSDKAQRAKYDAARSASTAASGCAASLAEAWEIFIKFTVDMCVRQFELGAAGSSRVIRLLSTFGVTTMMASYGGTGGVAVSAITAVLLNHDGAISVYNDLSDEQKIAFCQAVMVIARHVLV